MLKNEHNNEYTVPFDADLECKSHVVVYDGSTDSLDEDCTPAIACANKLWEMGSRNPVEVLEGGYETFSALYPFHRTQQVIYMPRELDTIQTYPSEIIPGLLYLGNWQHGNIVYIQKDLRIRAHINCCEQEETFFRDEGYFNALLHIPANDDAEPPYNLKDTFEEACDFINSHLKEKSAVLVFSKLGISRSATIIMAYLMAERKWSLQEAQTHVKKCRPHICPNSAFLSQLQSWYYTLNKYSGDAITESVHNIDLSATENDPAQVIEPECLR